MGDSKDTDLPLVHPEWCQKHQHLGPWSARPCPSCLLEVSRTGTDQNAGFATFQQPLLARGSS